MTHFCLKFFLENVSKDHLEHCEQCKQAWKEVQEENSVMEEIDGPLYHRTGLEMAALDSQGRP